jgi:hypothetical protein
MRITNSNLQTPSRPAASYANTQKPSLLPVRFGNSHNASQNNDPILIAPLTIVGVGLLAFAGYLACSKLKKPAEAPPIQLHEGWNNSDTTLTPEQDGETHLEPIRRPESAHTRQSLLDDIV